MTQKQTSLKIEGLVKGAKITLQRELSEDEDIKAHATELLEELNKLGITPIEEKASLATKMVLSDGLTPSPSLNTQIPEMPVLSNSPHTYNVGQAIIEILNPGKSIWAQQPRAVREIQERLTSIGVRGVSNIQNFDGVVRGLLKAGKIRREKIDDTYKYYFVSGETHD